MEFDLKDSRPHYGDFKRHQELFIQHLLHKEALSLYGANDDARAAHKVLLKWVNLEKSGSLSKKNETALEGEFLTQVFGEALGHTLWSAGKDHWHVEPKVAINGGQADAVLGHFSESQKEPLSAIIELKGPKVDLDRDRFNGRTPVEQCWDYMTLRPDCPWGVVSNFVSIRLYHRDHSRREYQLFLLRDLENEETFHKFLYLFSIGGVVSERAGDTSRAIRLLQQTGERQKSVGEELYQYYDGKRRELIRDLEAAPHSLPLEEAIRVAQKLLDRIIFIAFCEDRRLLNEKTIELAANQVPAFHSFKNPRWQNFRSLFRMIDKGEPAFSIPPFNGGLFRKDDVLDSLELDDSWAGFFHGISRYDFRDEVNVEVLGHIFERSINDLENILQTGSLGQIEPTGSKMVKSAERKRHGIYYTPRDFTNFIVNQVVGKTVDERFGLIAARHGLPLSEVGIAVPQPERMKLWSDCLESLKQLTVVDPACGSGAFLIAAYQLLEDRYISVVDRLVFHGGKDYEKLRDEIPSLILRGNIYGVDLSQEAVEITQLALWIRTASQGKTLEDLSWNIVWGNSLVDDKDVHPKAFKWEEQFHRVFSKDQPGFDCVVGNPPWERIKLQEREFFDAIYPSIASEVNASVRRKMIDALKETDQVTYPKYISAKQESEKLSSYLRNSTDYALTGKGDINTFAVFAELSHRIVAENGMVGILVPSGIATDDTTKNFFGALVQSDVLHALYDFENKAPIFPDVHRSLKISILLFGGALFKAKKTLFTFFAQRLTDLSIKDRIIELTAEDIKLMNPNTLTCPVFRNKRDAEITKGIYRRIPVLANQNAEDNITQWGVKFMRMFDQTNDSRKFVSPEALAERGFKLRGNHWVKGKVTYLPLYEAKMFRHYDHRFGSVFIKKENWVNQGQTYEISQSQHADPSHLAHPRWWVLKQEVDELLTGYTWPFLVAFRDITRATDSRTLIVSAIPYAAVANTAPIIFVKQTYGVGKSLCLLGCLNSMIVDYVSKQKISQLHMNFFILEQLPVLLPSTYDGRCPWNQRITLEKWVSERVLKLTCTSDDMMPLAKAVGIDSFVHKWDPAERSELMAELDAAYFILYGINRDDAAYILSTFSGTSDQPEGFFGKSSKSDLILEQYDFLKAKCK